MMILFKFEIVILILETWLNLTKKKHSLGNTIKMRWSSLQSKFETIISIQTKATAKFKTFKQPGY